MNDERVAQAPNTDEAIAADADTGVASAGQMIKEARIASGLHIGTLSMALKVPVKKLEALEANDWTVLPDVVFARALATSVCRQIKMDAAPVLAALPPMDRFRAIARTAEINTLNEPFRTPAETKFSWSKLPISMPMALGALALLLAAVVLIFLPSISQQMASTAQPVSEVAVGTPIFPPPTTQIAPELVPLPAEVTSAPVPAPALAISASTLPAAATASSPALATSTVSTVSTTAPILRITAKGEVWLQVKGSQGVVLVQRTLRPKEVVNVSGMPPLAVVIGRINEIESITVRGKSLSTVGMSPDNVARFEVK